MPKYTRSLRTEKFEALKRVLKSQQSTFTKHNTEQEDATRASFRVALEIAKRGKTLTYGEMIKECVIAVVEEKCPEKYIYLNHVSLSANTVPWAELQRIHEFTGEIGENNLP